MAEAAEAAPDLSGIVEDMGIVEEPQGEPETPEAETEETPAEPETPAAAAKPAHKLVVDDALFTEEALGTPEGIGKARDVLLAAQVKMSRGYGRLKSREEKLATQAQHVDQRERTIIRLGEGLQSDLQQLENGDATAIINTLGKLCRRDGIAVYQMLTDNMVLNGKRAKPSKEAQELRSELQQLRDAMVGKERQEQSQQFQQQELQAKQRIYSGASNAAEYPALAHFATAKPNEVVETLVQMKIEHHRQHGTVLDDAEAFRTLNAQLSRYAPTETGDKPDAGREPSHSKPGTQAARLGKTVSPSRASTASSRRTIDEMSDDERMAELARDPRDLFEQLGL
jgi:hypothetical protein